MRHPGVFDTQAITSTSIYAIIQTFETYTEHYIHQLHYLNFDFGHCINLDPHNALHGTCAPEIILPFLLRNERQCVQDRVCAVIILQFVQSNSSRVTLHWRILWREGYPPGQNFYIFMQFSRKNDRIVGCQLLWEILDPPQYYCDLQ